MRTEKERVVKLHEVLKKKMQILEGDKRTLDEQATALKLETAASEREIDTLKQQAENDKRQIESLLRERDLLSKNLLNADATAKKHADHAKRQLTHCEHLEKEVDGFRRECQQLQQKVETLEAERDRYGHTLNKSNQKYLESLEQLKNEELRVADLQRSIGEQQAKLAAQKTLYEAVRSDRNLFSRNLIASLDEMTELKHKFKLMFQQVGQLKEEIKTKDAGLLKQHFEHRRITSENEKLKDDLGKAEKKLSSLEQIIAAQKHILAERDMLGTQLLKRNQELSLLYEKERLKEIKEWSRQCLAFRRELRNLEGGVAEVESLKREILQLQKELLQERTKVRALTEALATPMNVHRWRRLEGTDPAKVELVIERDLQIQEREKLFVQLKDVRTKTKQLRAAVSELQVLHKESVKFSYIEEKRNEAREQQKQQQLQQQTTSCLRKTTMVEERPTWPFAAPASLFYRRADVSKTQPYWSGRRWNSVQQLSNALRSREGQRYASAGTPEQSAQLQMANSQNFANPTASASSQVGSYQTMLRNGTAAYQTPMAPYEGRSMAPTHPGVNSAAQPQYSEAFNPQVDPEGTRQSVQTSGTGPLPSPGSASNGPTSQYNGGVAANRFNGGRPMTSRPADANIRYPGSGRYTQSGRTISSFSGIASGDPYSSYFSQRRQGNQPTSDQAGSGDAESSSAGSTTEGETQPTETEEGESAEAGSSGRIGGRRVMNPYDLSHIFPDIYQEEQPASYENMTSQSLALLEMTTINSGNDEE
ncbi:Protein Ccdc146, related [Eimeria mitis]|uniref:Protein Ccdc146, related n=1 Tax=Eimeria mitis TaxID=44415 RepID=U6KJJ9_9EIME|nr:Protein Ccdc146, related [Eimeria mitis]CDJ35633.1 Protein Ccdc146, related [Eimeria mitis]